jgi:DNA-binding NtrC family response regulator
MKPLERVRLLADAFYRELMALDTAERGAVIDAMTAKLGTGEARTHATLDDELRSLEQQRVRESLERHGGNLSSAARELGITRPRLYRILKREA